MTTVPNRTNTTNHFFGSADLYAFVHYLNKLGKKTNWLFVTLDSNRGDSLNGALSNISRMLAENQVAHWTGQGGLWIPQAELTKKYVEDRIVVLFSAAFIFPENIKVSERPFFNATTDRGRAFDDSQIEACRDEIIRLGALAYATDGCGLQCVLSDEELSRRIDEIYP